MKRFAIRFVGGIIASCGIFIGRADAFIDTQNCNMNEGNFKNGGTNYSVATCGIEAGGYIVEGLVKFDQLAVEACSGLPDGMWKEITGVAGGWCNNKFVYSPSTTYLTSIGCTPKGASGVNYWTVCQYFNSSLATARIRSEIFRGCSNGYYFPTAADNVTGAKPFFSGQRFASNCAPCSGLNYTGGNFITSPVWPSGLNYNDMFRWEAAGAPGYGIESCIATAQTGTGSGYNHFNDAFGIFEIVSDCKYNK